MKGELNFIAFSDAHLTTANDEKYLKMLSVMKQITSTKNVNAVISLGDTPAMLGRNKHASNEEIKQFLYDSAKQIAEHTGLPVLAINGNHDAVGTDFFDPELWNQAVGSKLTQGLDVHDGSSVYYYVDYPENALRLVFLSLPHGSDITQEYPTPLWSFGDEQLKWLAEKALTVPEAYDVLLLCHVPVFYNYPRTDNDRRISVFDGECVREATIPALCGWIDDRDCFAEIMNAFSQKEASYINTKLNVNVDYSSAGSLIAEISGHTHKDQFFMPNEDCLDKESPTIKNPLPCPQIVIRNAITNEDNGYAFDLITIQNGRVSLSRFGDGESRAFDF